MFFLGVFWGLWGFLGALSGFGVQLEVAEFLGSFKALGLHSPTVGAANDRWTTPANYSVSRVLAAGRTHIDPTA